jgi:hypothetical protein
MTRPKQPRSRRRRTILISLVLAPPVLLLGLWIAVHKVEWLGPLLANGLRKVIGTDNVAKLEDFAYGVEDRFNRWWRKDEQPKAYWEVPVQEEEPATTPAALVPDAGEPELPPFRPADVGPVHEKWAAPGDGQWVVIRDPRRPAEKPYLFKTLIHPDKYRSWAELFVVAIDLRRSELFAVAGRAEPKSFEKEGMKYQRKALIPSEHHEELLAAFNGGFMTEHGYYGMKVDGVVLVKPRETACTIAAFEDGKLEIATWKALAEREPSMAWYRQTPGCMVERGQMHRGLLDPSSRAWGATLDGETVIRRSAIGLNEARDVLYVGVSNHTTARAIADGMAHAGAADVAQLDVNWSYPKFLLYEPGEGGADRKAVPIAPGFEHHEDEYIRRRAPRDFFYLMRKSGEPAPQN